MPYTRHVAGRRNAGFLACLLLLTGIMRAGTRVASAPLKLVPHVTYGPKDSASGPATTSLGGWEVAVGFDAARCEVFCIYRQKPDRFGQTPVVNLLPPPITIVEVYTGIASKPEIVTFDPAGLGLPGATSKLLPVQEKAFLPGRRLVARVLTPQADCVAEASHQAHCLFSCNCPGLTVAPVLSLRI